MSDQCSVQQAIDYIETNLNRSIKLSDVAEAAYISQAQLYRIFYALTGHPVMEYIRKRRVSEAAARLHTTSSSVSDIALACGFDSYITFAKIFKKAVGQSPSAYRSSDTIYCFEPFCFRDKAYDDEISKDWPSIAVTRLWPQDVAAYSHISDTVEGIENAALQEALRRFERLSLDTASFRCFGLHEDVPPVDGKIRYGYKIMLMGDGISGLPFHSLFRTESWLGGLYAVRTTDNTMSSHVIDAWNSLLEEWLPASRFERGKHSHTEEFVFVRGKLTRMSLYLPVVRIHSSPSIAIVDLHRCAAICASGIGAHARANAEHKFMEWYKSQGCDDVTLAGDYYISGSLEMDEYWENGLIQRDDRARIANFDSQQRLERRWFPAGRYAYIETGTYGDLSGIRRSMTDWISSDGRFHIDRSRPWYARYETVAGGHLINETRVHVYVPLI